MACDVTDVGEKRQATLRGVGVGLHELNVNRSRHLVAHELDDVARLLIDRFGHHQRHGRVERINLLEHLDEGGAKALERMKLYERHEVVDDEPIGSILPNDRNQVVERLRYAFVPYVLQIEHRRNTHQLNPSRLVRISQIETQRGRLNHQVFRTIRRDEQAPLSQIRSRLYERHRKQTVSRRCASINEIRSTPIKPTPGFVYYVDAG